MSLKEHAAKSFQIRYLKVYLGARLPSNDYLPDVDVSRYVVDKKIGKYSQSIDSDPFGIGFYVESNIKLSLDNDDQLFTEGKGYFSGAIIDRSKFKVVAGYRDTDNPENADFETTFEGIIDDRLTQFNDDDSVDFTVLSYSGILSKLRTDPGAVTNGQSFQTAFFNLLNRPEVKNLLTLDIANINPKVDLEIQDYTYFVGKQMKQALDSLLLAASSVMLIVGNTIKIVPRNESKQVRFQFYGLGTNKACNIINLDNYVSGLSRVINRVEIDGDVYEASNALIQKYGANLQSYDIPFITDDDYKRSVANTILDEFSYPKPELELTTDFIGNEIKLLDLVTIDNEGVTLDENPAVYGRAVYGEATYVQRKGSLRISGLVGYKVLSIDHDFNRFTTTLGLRQIGLSGNDSLIINNGAVYGQSIYGLATYVA